MTARPSPTWRCRSCGGRTGEVVLDLGRQPAADRFPLVDDPRPDPVHPLRMVLCGGCGLAQLEDDPTGAEEPRGVEPAALVEQARRAVADLAASGLVGPGVRTAEIPSPHGGSWLDHVAATGATVLGDPADGVDLLVDSMGLMHEPDQGAALRRRARVLAPEGVLALHVHPLSTILREGTWNALRHGHFAYWSLTALVAAAGRVGLVPVGRWDYPLYGGTVVLALARRGSRRAVNLGPGCARGLGAVLDAEAALGVTDPARVRVLQEQVGESVAALRSFLEDQDGEVVVGYGAASRAVTLLAGAGVTATELVACVDASPAKHGRALPGLGRPRVPVVAPEALRSLRPDRVLLFVPDLLDEVRAACPEVEADGGRWVIAEPVPHAVEPVGAAGPVSAAGTPARTRTRPSRHAR